MIAWQIHIIAVVKFNDKDSAESIASIAKLNPYVVRKTLGLTRNLSQKQVKDLVSKALALDVRLKSEIIDADDAVQHFLLNI
jgi:DNA polymerase III delta subunit